MKRAVFLAALLIFFSAPGWATRRYEARGLVLEVDQRHDALLVSCEKIPGFMDAMAMSFAVRDRRELGGLDAGTMVDFSIVVEQASSYIEKIHIHRYEGVEQDPLGARRLKLLAEIASTASAQQALKTGDHVPDFSLTDQNKQTVALSAFSGKVVAITFTYTHCALPNFCFRIANHFRQLQKRFSSRLGSDLILMTITFDPVHDTPDVMAKYGKTWNADPRSWKLLTGSEADVEAVCNKFGISHWADEGLMTHSLHTILIDRGGNLVADMEGNEFSADQLGDLVQTLLARTPERSVPGVPR
jgi:protein SCO1/2